MTRRNKEWERDVYQKGKALVMQLIRKAGRPVPFSEICGEMKIQYPQLCDDSVQDPWAPVDFFQPFQDTGPIEHA